jgi:hypothetical protein
MADQGRIEALIKEDLGLYLDFSRQRLTPETMKVRAPWRARARRPPPGGRGGGGRPGRLGSAQREGREALGGWAEGVRAQQRGWRAAARTRARAAAT